MRKVTESNEGHELQEYIQLRAHVRGRPREMFNEHLAPHNQKKITQERSHNRQTGTLCQDRDEDVRLHPHIYRR